MPRKPIMQVKVRGRIFPSARACADHFKLAVCSVYSAVARNQTDRIGLGPDYKARSKNHSHKGGRKPRKVTIGGMQFESIAALARFIGREPRNTRTSLVGGEIARQRIVTAVIRRIAETENAAARASWKEQRAA